MAELLQFQFARGMDEGVEPKGAAAGTPLALTNCYLDKRGLLVKRPGLSVLAATILGGGSISAGARIVTRGDDLAIFDGEKLYSRIASVTSWQAIDRPSPLTVRQRPLIDCTRSVRTVDIAITGNLLVTFYETGTTTTTYLYVEIRKLDTGEIVKPAEYVATGSRPRAVMNNDGTVAYLLWSNAAGEIYVATLTMSTFAVVVQTTLTASAVADTTFDAIVPEVSGADKIYLIYCLAAGASRIRVESFETTGYASVDTATVAGTTMGPCCIVTDGTYVHAVYDKSSSSDVCLLTTDMSLGSAVGPTNVDTTVGAPAPGACFVAVHSASNVLVGWSRDDGARTQGFRLTSQLMSVAAHAVTASSVRITFGVTQPTRPWSINSRWYTAVSTYNYPYSLIDYSAVPAASVVVLELETAASLTGTTNGTHPHVATLENQTGWIKGSAALTSSAADASGNVYVPSPYRNREPTTAWTTPALGYNLATVTTSDPSWGRLAALGRGALGASAAPFWWDGASAMPYGFVAAPIIASLGVAAGGSMVAGVYGYLYSYGWRDANGTLHRSPVSPSKSGTTAGGNLTLVGVVSSSAVSGKQRASFGTATASPVWLHPHRTTINGSNYYAMTVEPNDVVVFNDPQADDVTFTDTLADAALATGVALSSMPQVYTAGGVLDDVCPPAALDALAHRDRGWLLAADGHTVWATKSVGDDPLVAPGFNEALTLYFTDTKACLGALDEAVVVLGARSIDIVSGDGPDVTGSGAWGRRGVQTDRGSTNPRSIATIPAGLVFQSTLGIEMLSRDLTVQWIGEPVRDQMTTYPVVTSAVVVPHMHQLRISVENAAADDGVVLVYDYLRGVWSVWDYGFPVADAAYVGGVYTVLRYNGVVYQERTTSCRDGTTYVEMSAEIVVQPSGAQAWSRLKHAQVLGTSVTAHKLTMKIRRDFATDYEYEHTFDADSEVTDVGPLEKARITPPMQKGQGFVVRISDAAPDSDDTSDAGEGPQLESLAVYVQRKEGPARVSAAQRG